MPQPNSPEQFEEILKDNPYGETVRALIADAGNFNTDQLSQLIHESLVAQIAESAEKGELYSQYQEEGSGEIKTHLYTVKDIISGQIADALKIQEISPNDARTWARHIPRSNGLREALVTIMKDQRLAEPFRLAVLHKQTELEKGDDATDDFDLAVKAAKSATDIEAAVDARTETLLHDLDRENGEPLDEEEIREIGEEGLVAADVKEPAPEFDTEQMMRARQMHSMYEQSALGLRLDASEDIGRFAARLDESEQALASVDQTIVQATMKNLTKFDGVVSRIEDYPVQALQTEIKQTINDLYTVVRTTQILGEGTLQDIHRGVTSLERAVQDYKYDAEARDGDFKAAAAESDVEIAADTVLVSTIMHDAEATIKGTKELHLSLNNLDKVLGEVLHRSLRQQIKRLEDVLHDSYTQPVDAVELAAISSSIKQGLEGEELRGALNAARTNLYEYIGQVRQALAVLNPR